MDGDGAQLQYPYDLVIALMNRLPNRCSKCDAPATRYVVTSIVLGNSTSFCDKHEHSSLPGNKYEDLYDAKLVRACNQYLQTTEQKT